MFIDITVIDTTQQIQLYRVNELAISSIYGIFENHFAKENLSCKVINYKSMKLGVGQDIFVPYQASVSCMNYLHTCVFILIHRDICRYCVSGDISAFFLLDRISVFHRSEDLVKIHTNIFSFF